MMLHCWADDPTHRPTFHDLVFVISKLLEDGIDYLKVNGRFVSNPEYECDNPALALIHPPNNAGENEKRSKTVLFFYSVIMKAC